MLLGAVVFDDDGNEIDQGDFIVPTSSVTIKDDWFVSGLAGTGSCTMVVEGIDVPAHRFLSMPGLIMGNSPGADLHGDDWVHRCAPVPVLTIALCGGAIGIAKQALADFPSVIKGKIIAYTADPQEPHPFTHIRLGDAASRIREGELLLYAVADELDADRPGRRRGALPAPRRDAQRLRDRSSSSARGCRDPVPRVRRDRRAHGEPDRTGPWPIFRRSTITA